MPEFIHAWLIFYFIRIWTAIPLSMGSISSKCWHQSIFRFSQTKALISRCWASAWLCDKESGDAGYGSGILVMKRRETWLWGQGIKFTHPGWRRQMNMRAGKPRSHDCCSLVEMAISRKVDASLEPFTLPSLFFPPFTLLSLPPFPLLSPSPLPWWVW